jgi:hypothetical protein
MRAWIHKVEGDASKFECRACDQVWPVSGVYLHMKGKAHANNLVAYMEASRGENEADDELERYLNHIIYYFIKTSYKKTILFI